MGQRSMRWGKTTMVAVLAVIAAGCMRADIGVTVEEDGSGVLTFAQLYGPEFRELADELDLDEDEEFTEFEESMPDGAEFSDVVDGEYEGRQATMTFDSLEELNALADEALVVEPDEQGTFDSFAVTQDGSAYAFDAVYRESDFDDFEGENDVEPGQVVVMLELPGTVTDDNADEVDGDVLTWRIPLDESATLRARTQTELVGGFTDVAGTTHADAIAWVADQEIAAGRGDGTFGPNDDVTRGQMATFLTRALELPAGDASFPDAVGTTHEEGISAVAEAGITEGRADGTFGPNDSVTRGQMAAFLQRALDE